MSRGHRSSIGNYGSFGNCMNTVTIYKLLAEFTLKKPDNLPNLNADASLPKVLSFIFGFLALLAVLFIVIGGIQYTLSNGEANKIQEAKNTILYAIIGLVLSILAFVVVSFVMAQIGAVK